MPNSWFQFKQFTVHQERCAMKVTTEACLFGAWVVARIKKVLPEKARVLDVGAGTGLLSLMLTQELSIEIDAVEIDAGAVQDATANFKAAPFRDRLRLHHAAIQEFKSATAYPLIISNPPFYSNSLKANSSAKNLARHDAALEPNELFLKVKSLLASDGFVAILYPAPAAGELVHKAKQMGLNAWATALVHQTPKHAAFRVMHIFYAGGSGIVPTQTIFIKNEEGEYSDEFRRLLQPYYLHL